MPEQPSTKKRIQFESKERLNASDVQKKRTRLTNLCCPLDAQQIYDSSTTAILVTNQEGVIFSSNQAAEELLGVAKKHLLGKPFVIFVNPRNQQQYYKGLRQALASGNKELHFQLRSRSGKIYPCIAQLRQADPNIDSVDDDEQGMFLVWNIRLAEYEHNLELRIEDLSADLNNSASELKTLKAETATLLNAKNEFVAHLTHELRTPLQSVFGAAELLGSSNLTAEQKELIEVICSSAKQLKDVAESALHLTSIESGKDQINVSEFEIEPFILDILGQFKIQVREKNIGLNLKIDQNIPPRIVTDAVRLRQILINTISNGVKFTSEGSITVSLRPFENKDKLLFEVSDTGSGMASQALEHLFQPYECASGYESKFRGGMGLGLYICKQLVESLDGNISVESEPGKGCKILFVLPLRSLPLAQPLKLDKEPLAEAEFGPVDQNIGDTKSVSVNAITPNLRVLLAEDSDVTAKIVSLQLRQLGCAVERARNGAEAVSMFSPERFDLVFMDCQMPVMDGYAAAEQIRKTHSTSTPIIALTGNVGEKEKEHCLEKGMNEYLSKPAGLSDFQRVLNHFVSRV
jgi:PAS domain S-box-containing protein